MNYLFCYFTGNEPENETVHFAVSQNGYDFTALNSGKPIIKQRLGKGCMRDPFIFRDRDNRFHIIATDMKSSDGWNSNSTVVMWDSDNLIDWVNERIFDMHDFAETKSADRVWAPQIIYDKACGEYMIYWSHHNTDDDFSTVIRCIYTKDFETFTTAPRLLFAPKSGLAGIDADIIEWDGKFLLLEADEGKDAICCAQSDSAGGVYHESEDNIISVADTALEGCCAYKNENNSKFIMIADRFKNGGYFMQEGDTPFNCTEVPEDKYSLNHLNPRHGSMLAIDDEEYNRLVSCFK